MYEVLFSSHLFQSYLCLIIFYSGFDITNHPFSFPPPFFPVMNRACQLACPFSAPPIASNLWPGQPHLPRYPDKKPAALMEPRSGWPAKKLQEIGGTEKKLPSRTVNSVNPGYGITTQAGCRLGLGTCCIIVS